MTGIKLLAKHDPEKLEVYEMRKRICETDGVEEAFKREVNKNKGEGK